MSERVMAWIAKIDNVETHPNADALDICTVGGWKVVSQKGLYRKGDLAVYASIDSWIPNEIAPFLSKGQEPREYNGVKGERLRTIKLRGVISQGLLLPFGICMSTYDGEAVSTDWNIGDDVSELLGIQKYEPPIPACLAGEVKGVFPSFIPKTDESRIQNLSDEWEELKTIDPWFITEKIDGTSFTAYIKGDTFGVCSRNLELRENESNTHWKFVRDNGIEEKMRQFRSEHGNVDFAIQGELAGEGIQKNLYKLKGHKVFLFNAYNITDCAFFGWDTLNDISVALGIETVPILGEHQHFEPDETIDNILKFASGKSVLNPSTEREGVVFKTYAREKSFKAISNNFLMKHDN